MATLATLVDDCYGILYGIGQAERPAEDLINGSLAQGATSVTMDTDKLWKRGTYAEFVTDGELIIFAADASGATTIRRGQRGTTDVAQADNSLVYRDPTFPRYEIERLINQVVRDDLWPNVWSWHKDTVSFVSADFMYPLDAFIEAMIDAELTGARERARNKVREELEGVFHGAITEAIKEKLGAERVGEAYSLEKY